MNTVERVDGVLVCGCGAKCIEKNKERRFDQRHPKICSKKVEFTKQLAKFVKCVGTSQEEDVDVYRLEQIEATGRNLTEWESKFIIQMRVLVDRYGSSALTDNMKKSLEWVYATRTN